MPSSSHRDAEKHQEQVDRIRGAIRSYPDFPKPGILFRSVVSLFLMPDSYSSFFRSDFLPILSNVSIFDDLIEVLVGKVKHHPQVDTIVGLDARGFLLGPVIAHRMRLKFVPVRKAGAMTTHSLTPD